MGTWGTGILDDDFARDVHDRYLQAHDAGRSSDAIVETLLDEFASAVADPDEGPLFWLAVAQAQWDCSTVDPQVRERVETIVGEGLGLERWHEAGPKEVERRRAALTRFLSRIATPRARKRRTPGADKATVPFVVGDCLAIDLDDGLFGAAIVTKHLPGASSSHILSVVDFYRPEPPEPGIFTTPAWMAVTPAPALTIMKYSVYAPGYRRHGRRYRAVVRVDPGEVPPPLTLGLGNWGNVWSDLGARLRKRAHEGS